MFNCLTRKYNGAQNNYLIWCKLFQTGKIYACQENKTISASSAISNQLCEFARIKSRRNANVWLANCQPIVRDVAEAFQLWLIISHLRGTDVSVFHFLFHEFMRELKCIFSHKILGDCLPFDSLKSFRIPNRISISLQLFSARNLLSITLDV